MGEAYASRMVTDRSSVSNTHVVAARAAAVIAAAAALGLSIGPGAAAAANYKDGTYSAVGAYTIPVGPSDVGLTMTLKNNIVTAASIRTATLPVSRSYQEAFWRATKSKVVGKNIDDINVGKAAGSSLTPNGFNAAVAQIKSQARQ